MGTTILAWLIAILELLMIAGGVWDLVDLCNQRRQTVIRLLRHEHGRHQLAGLHAISFPTWARRL